MVDVTKYPLPDGVEDVVLNREQLADALRVSAPTIDTYRKAGMPVITEGSNGRSYEFLLSDCFAWVSERKEIERTEDERKQNAIKQMQFELIGADGDDPYSELTMKQAQEAYKTEGLYREAALARGEFMMRSRVTGLVTDIFQIYREGLGVLPDRLARECGLTHEQVERVARICDGMLTETAKRIERDLGKPGNHATDTKLSS
nr:hypothetical protein [uncultured Cohaesibacter sp.]